MRNKRRGAALGMLLLAAAAAPAAAAERETTAEDEARNQRPEYQARPLPDDTFTPSEEVSEDFPVPFPVDI